MAGVGISIQDSLHNTHIRAPRPSDILTLHNLPSFVPLHLSLLSSKHIRFLVLHAFLSSLSKHITSVFLSNILLPPISPPIFHQSISSVFTLQTLLAQEQWSTAYKNYPDTNFLMKNLHHNAPMNRLCITKLAITYRKVLAHNLYCIISYRLIYLEPIIVSTNHICRIIVPLSLRRIILNSMHA